MTRAYFCLMRAFLTAIVGLALAILGTAWVNATWSLSYAVPTCSVFAVSCPVIVFIHPNFNTYIGVAAVFSGLTLACVGFVRSLKHRNWRLRTKPSAMTNSGPVEMEMLKFAVKIRKNSHADRVTRRGAVEGLPLHSMADAPGTR
jgi:hypothetical protein